jgi:four helix bundle protein
MRNGEEDTEKKLIRTHQDLEVHKIAYRFAMQIFREPKSSPMESRYSLKDHVCRSSRSACAYLAEAWRKERDEDRLLPITLI